ncbi:MAG: hypothetical protein IT175_12290 [Acidobacteria bacterium]|nr:hypothetical protein [Acidobacteriota bacterium]
MLKFVFGAIALCVFAGVTTWIAKIQIKRRMELQLGRKVDDSELTSITGWMKAHDRQNTEINSWTKEHDRADVDREP